MEPNRSATLMREFLNKDRLEYIEIIKKARRGVGSREITEKILELKGIISKNEIIKENIVVNKRLRTLVSLGILVSQEGKYELSSLGYLLLDSWENLDEKVTTMNKFDDFFDIHSANDIPKEFFRQMYKLRNAELTGNASQWQNKLREQVEKVERKLYGMTQSLHDFPEEIIGKKRNMELDIAIIYQFDRYPELNYPDKKSLFDELIEAGAEFRYISLENKRPIGILVVDEKWATFLLSRFSEGTLDRNQAFIGSNLEFVSWCRDLMYHVWSFEAKHLNAEDVIARRKD